MAMEIYTLDYCLKALAGYRNCGDITFDVSYDDMRLIKSFADQVSRTTALTDRQYALAKEKVLEYAGQFPDNINVEESVQHTVLPIREIDRAKWIQIEDYNDNKFIVVRFVFNKRFISKIEAVKEHKDLDGYFKDERKHFFPLTEINLFYIVENFKNCDFEISNEVMTLYQEINEFAIHPYLYVPGIYNYSVENVPEHAIYEMEKQLGRPSEVTLALYKDRAEYYGIKHFDADALENSIKMYSPLTQKIIQRKKNRLLAKTDRYRLDEVVKSIYELNRFPLMMVVDSAHAHEKFDQLYNAIRHLVARDEMSVLFRLDNSYNADFNEYIREQQLNNQVTKDTKVIFVLKDSFPKPLIKMNWVPSAVLTTSNSMVFNKIATVISNCDLVIDYDSAPSSFTTLKEVTETI